MKLPDRVPLDITVFPFGDMKSAQMYRESRCMSDRDSTIISAFGCYFLCTWAVRQVYPRKDGNSGKRRIHGYIPKTQYVQTVNWEKAKKA